MVSKRLNVIHGLKRHRMTELGSDGNLNVMFFKIFQIICLMTLLTKREEGQTLEIYCQEHRSSFYIDIIRKHDGRTYT